jgi:NADH-quinone oxidoreductase subunit J
MKIMLILLILMVLATLWSVMTPILIRAAIALALTSAILSVIMFRLNAPLAAVFELSVCAGLISVIFISVITLTHRLPFSEYLTRRKNRIQRFRYLPFILVVAAIALSFVRLPLNLPLPWPEAIKDVRTVMWDFKRFDLFGQIIVLLAGAYGILVLFKGEGKDER